MHKIIGVNCSDKHSIHDLWLFFFLDITKVLLFFRSSDTN